MYFITHSAWLKALGWSLLNSFWQMALLWLFYQLISGMGKRYSAGIRHGLALALSGIGSIWFLFTGLTAVTGHGSAYTGLSEWGMKGSVLNTMIEIREVFNILVPYLAILYLGGLCFLFFPYIQNYRRLRELRIEGIQKMPAPLRIFVQSTCVQMGIRRKVLVWISSMVDSPLTVGFLKPIILFPIATVNHLSLEQVETILLHELAHIKRNDYLVNLLISWMEILFFFNPFSRLLVQTVKKEREHCCDDLVIQFKYNPHVYATALLSLEKSRSHHASLALAAIGKSQQLLLERIRRFTGHKRRRSGFNMKITAFFLVNLLICPALFFQPRPIARPAERAMNAPASLENRPASFVSNQTPQTPKVFKFYKAKKQKYRLRTNQDNFAGHAESLYALVSENDQPDQLVSESVASSASLTDERDFSITAGPAPAATAPINTITNNFPYVPSTSFLIQEPDDTSSPEPPTQKSQDPEARASMEKALLALNEINWKQLERNINASGKKINSEILRDEISRAMREANWDKINGRLSGWENNAKVRTLIENIQLQTKALNKMRVQTRPAAIQLQLKIKENQLKLKQETLKREIQIIQQQSESLGRGKKIVYI